MATATHRSHLQVDTFFPPRDTRVLVDLARFLADHTEPASLVGPDGERTLLPTEVYNLLMRVVSAMQSQKAITIAPVDKQLTTQEAADLLGISRPTLIKVIKRGELDCDRPSGSRHRRLRLQDVLDYRQRRAAQRGELLAAMVKDAEADGLYDIPAQDYRDAVRQARAERQTDA